MKDLEDPRKLACRTALDLKEPMAKLFQGFQRGRLDRVSSRLIVPVISHREDLKLCELVVPAAKIVHRMKEATTFPRTVWKITPLDRLEHGVDGVFCYAFPLLLKRRTLHFRLPVHYLPGEHDGVRRQVTIRSRPTKVIRPGIARNESGDDPVSAVAPEFRSKNQPRRGLRRPSSRRHL